MDNVYGIHATLSDSVFDFLAVTAALSPFLSFVDEFADLLPFPVQLLLLVLSAFHASRLSSIGHFHAELEGGFGQSFSATHVFAVFLLCVEVPTTNGPFLVALLRGEVRNMENKSCSCVKA